MPGSSHNGNVVDIHTHILSLDPGSGCYLTTALQRRPIFRFLKWRYGLDADGNWQIDDGRLQAGFQRAFSGMGEADQVVILALDAVYDEAGRLDERNTHFYIPNDYIFNLARQNPRLLPGASIHPNRRDALDELQRCHEQGAVLIKWLPNTQGFDPARARYKPFYRALKNLGLPLLCHTGHEHSLNSIDQMLGNPLMLRMALEEGVTVIAAHGGGSELFNDGQFDSFLEMLLTYPNLYTDTSALSLPNRKRYLLKLLKHTEVHHKLIHGSDFPLPINAWAFVGHLPVWKILKINQIDSPIQRDLVIKRELGFPSEVFTRGGNLITRSANVC